MNPEFLGTPEHLITTEIDVEEFISKKMEALFCHQSQIGANSFFKQVPQEMINEFFRFEHYVCVIGCNPGNDRENDLFYGLR